MTRLTYHYARRTAGLIASKHSLTRDQTRQVCCIATLAIHQGAELRDSVAAARRLAATLHAENTVMIERQQPLPHQVNPCRCGQQPRLYQHAAKYWFVECAPCAIRTQRFDNDHRAIAAWQRGETRSILCTRLKSAA